MKYQELIKNMTLEEKASLTSGKDFWQTVDIRRLGIPSITFADGPHGIRKQAGSADHLGLNPSLPATCFPTAAAMANSWDIELAEQVGAYLGEEAASQGVHVLLGPGLNIKRSPLCGRNFEYFSEDPYLSGKMAAAYIRGIQSQGAAACPKHFAVNSQELRRMSVDSVVDERTFREIYLTGFEIAVKEGNPKTIMSAYNKINGIYAHENPHLLQEILTEEWGFDGIVVSDWGGSNDHAASVCAGGHLEMPSTGADGVQEIIKAVKEGRLSESVLDQRVAEILKVTFAVSEGIRERKGIVFDESMHHEMAARAAESSIVLLKNEEELLPLSSGTRVGIIGDFAGNPRYQGAGSSMVNVTKLDSVLDLIDSSGLEFVGYEPGFLRRERRKNAANTEKNVKMRNAAVALAKRSDVVLCYLGLDEQKESEGLDRQDMKLEENQIQVLQAIAEVNPNIVVILSAGAVVEMSWISHAKAVLHGYLSGQAGAGAMLNVIMGKVCPSGRLNETYPIRYEDTPAYAYYPGKEKSCEYREGLYVGYRYYDTAEIPVRFPFGYGLSYTTFAYSDLNVSKEKVSLTVTNTGKRDGAEVVQIYVGKLESRIYRPKKELKGFCKVFLKAGESKRVEIALGDMAFRYFDVQTGAWKVEDGLYEIMAASNVQDVKLTAQLQMSGYVPDLQDKSSPYSSGRIKNVSDEAFEKLLGHRIPGGSWKMGEELGLNDTLCQMQFAKSRLARLAFWILDKLKKWSEKQEKPDLNILFIYNMPFRGMAKMCGGMVSMDMARAVVEMVNGHFWSGLKALLLGFRENMRLQRSKRR